MRQALAEERPERLGAATASGANEGLELREAELDGIEVRAVGWQVPEGGPGGLDGALDAGDLVGPEIVGNDDVAGLQGRHQDLFDVGAEALAIDRAVEDPGAVSPVTRNAARNVLVCQRPQGAWSWTRAPRGARPYRRSRLVVLPVSSSNTRWATSQVGAAACHATPRGRDVRPIVFGRAVRFFLTVRPRARTARQTVGTLAGVARASFSSAQRAIRVRRNQRGQGV